MEAKLDKDQKSKLRWANSLIDLMDERGLSELEIESKGERVRFVRAGVSGVVSHSYESPPPAAASVPSSVLVPEDSGEEQWESHAGAVKSPIVGTVYLAESPTSAPFASVGDKVKEGQTILIIEAMKVMNPIQAHCSGVLKRILVSNEQPVEYGQVLAVIE